MKKVAQRLQRCRHPHLLLHGRLHVLIDGGGVPPAGVRAVLLRQHYLLFRVPREHREQLGASSMPIHLIGSD